jgi:VIT1/CCC1 family predicted Fe2+/Mn2+ transporter
LAVAFAAPLGAINSSVTLASLASLALLGGIGAKVGGAGVIKPVGRVVLWGALAMALTYGIGRLVGAPIG